ncbi:hypothetical protein AOQ84DRAFT_411931, partial [Glonium stellatum]
DFHIHKELLSDNSPFFTNAMKKEWTKCDDCILELPDDDPNAVQIYVAWLYCNRIFAQLEVGNTKVAKEYEALLDAYIFRDKIQDHDFKDAIRHLY